MPSSRARHQTWATARSACFGSWSRSKTPWRSDSDRAFGGLGRTAGAGGAAPEQATGLLDPDRVGQVAVVGVDHLVYFSSVSALSESISKSACAFPTMSRAVRVFFSSASSRSFFRRSRSASLASALRAPRGLAPRAARDPASRAFLHSVIGEL